MKKYHINIFLIASVIALLVLSGGVSGVVNTFQSTTSDFSQQENIVTENAAIITCYLGGIPHSQVISSESGMYLKELFYALATANACDPHSDKTLQLQQQILGFAEVHELLPAEMSSDTVLAHLRRKSQRFVPQNSGEDHPRLYAGTGRELFCNFVSIGEGAAFPIIILPRFIPIIMAPIPRLFVGWKTDSGLTSCGGLVSRTGFLAGGRQQGFALGFWGIGFSIFLPPVMAYGMFGYALYAKVSAEAIEFYPPNHPPEIAAVYPLNGATYVPLSTSKLEFHISDFDGDRMSYKVTTYPDVGGGNGNAKPDGTYTVPISGLKSSTEYIWYVTVSDGSDTVETKFKFTTEAVAPIISDVFPREGDRYVPTTQDVLRFHLRDPQNDRMSYTVETSPFIGSGSDTGVGEGYITIPISGLESQTTYRWFVNVTDGENPTSEVFWFRTEPMMVFDPFAEGWEYRKLITINHTMVAGDLEFFPVLISISDIDLKQKAQNDGDDILFMDGAGTATRVFHELEEFDSITGQLIAWVNISSLSSTADTLIYMYYGNMDSDEQQCPEKTWDSNYKSVYHMNDATPLTIADSTFNEYIGTKVAVNSPNEANGKIGKNQDFDGVNDYVQYTNPVIPVGKKTISTWMNRYSTDGSYAVILASSTGISSSDSGTGWGINDGARLLQCFLGNGHTSGHYMTVTVPIPDTHVWHYYTMTYDETTLQVYIDGILVGSTTSKSGSEATPTYNLRIGKTNHPNYEYLLNAGLDELRISNTSRSNAWILTSYRTMNDPMNFFSVGPEELGP